MFWHHINNLCLLISSLDLSWWATWLVASGWPLTQSWLFSLWLWFFNSNLTVFGMFIGSLKISNRFTHLSKLPLKVHLVVFESDLILYNISRTHLTQLRLRSDCMVCFGFSWWIRIVPAILTCLLRIKAYLDLFYFKTLSFDIFRRITWTTIEWTRVDLVWCLRLGRRCLPRSCSLNLLLWACLLLIFPSLWGWNSHIDTFIAFLERWLVSVRYSGFDGIRLFTSPIHLATIIAIINNVVACLELCEVGI